MSATDAVMLGDVDWAVRAEIYRVFAETGSAPTLEEIARAAGRTERGAQPQPDLSHPSRAACPGGLCPDDVRAALGRLYAAHEIAPLPDGSGVWMANPFSAVRTDYVVETRRMICYAACAWDALGVPAILGGDAWISTRCAGSGEPLEHPQVLHEGRQRHVERLRQLAHGSGPAPEPLHDGAAGRIGQCAKHVVNRLGSSRGSRAIAQTGRVILPTTEGPADPSRGRWSACSE